MKARTNPPKAIHVQGIHFIAGEDPFHALLEAAPDAMVIVNSAGRIVEVNQQAERLFLYPRDELLGQLLELLLPESVRPRHVRHRRDYYAEPHFRPMGASLPLAARRKDGTEFPVEVSLSPLQTANGVLVISAIRDITARYSGKAGHKAGHSEVDARARHLASFPELNPNPVLEVDVSGQITFANRATHQVLERLGLDPAQVNAFLPTDMDGILQDWDKKSALALDREVGLQDKIFGESVWLVPELGVARIYGYEITERKQAQERISHLNRALEQRALDLETANEELQVANEELEVANEELRVANEDLAKEIQGRQRAEQALRASEERFRFVLAKSPVIVAHLDRELRYTWVYNPATGYTPEDVIGKTPGMSTDPEATMHMLKLLQGVVEKGESAQWEITSRTSAGDKVFESHAEPLRNAQGHVTGVAMVSIDITERKQVEQALRESEERFRLAARATNDAIWDIDLTTGTVQWNERYLALFGRPPEMSGSWQWWIDHIHPDDRERTAHGLRSAVDGRESIWTCEYRFQRTDGVWAYIYDRAYIARDESGKPWRVVGAMQDLTERKVAEEALRRRTEELQAIMEAVPTAVFITRDPEARTITGNRAARDLVELPPQANISKTAPAEELPTGWQEMRNGIPIAPQDLPLQQAARGNEVREYEMDLVFREGTIKSVLGYATPLRDKNGSPQGAVAVLMDVTQRKRAEEHIQKLNQELEQRAQDLETTSEELEVSNEELRQVNEELDTALAKEQAARIAFEVTNKELEAFIYAVAHDLRAPLNLVEQFAGMVLADYGPQLPEPGERLIRLIEKNAVAVNRLAEDLLTLSRLGQQTLTIRKVSMHDLVRAALSELEPARAGREVEITLGELPPAQGDLHLLTQVWVNLISNALKFTRGRAVAHIEIGSQPCPGPDALEGCIAYYVKDNGAGFDMAQVNRLFRAFHRLHHSEDFEGKGLGLNIVQRIITRHGGRVWAQAQVDQGATFYFTLR